MASGPSFLRYLFARGDSGPRGRAVAVKLARLYLRDRWRWSTVRVRASVDEVPIDRPIFVLGLQSGGTTLISRCLRRSREVVTISGDHRHWTGIDELGAVRNRTARLPPDLWGSKYRSDLEHPVYGDDHSSVFACDELLPRYRRTAQDADAPARAAFERLIREHVALHARGAGRFLDKTHTSTVPVAYVDALLRNHRPSFVLVTRNPYTTCPHALRRKPPSYRVDLPYPDRLRAVAEHWRNANALALADGARAANFLVVRFEDFLREPEVTVRRLCTFLGLTFEESMVPRAGDALPFATLASDRKWFPLYEDRSVASPGDVAIVDEVCGELAADLGYAPPGEGDVELRTVGAAGR